MIDDKRWKIRAILLGLLVVTGGYLGVAQATNDTRHMAQTYFDEADKPLDERQQVVAERPNATVVTTRGGKAAIGTDALYVFGSDGRLLYLENRTQYADVDPSSEGETALLIAADKRGAPGCEARCSKQHIRYVNYSTGETRDVFTHVSPSDRNSNWHDVDRVGENEYAVAGIYDDRVWVVDTENNVTTWSWSLQHEFSVEAAGPFPGDYAHLNDVEKLPDGRYMISPRNHDQVLFIHPETGLQEDWTLGSDDDFATMYEQHNPDYIPEERGGPAVLLADSENNRVVEYQRVDGEWVKSWVWQDEEMDWPRDADRLPNGHTLITDTHQNRVIEVDEEGEIVWSAKAPNGYEAERLGTGDESAGGPSAAKAGLESRTSDENGGAAHKFANEAEWTWYSKLSHGAQHVLPSWVGFTELAFAVEGLFVLFAWAIIELRWRGVQFRRPVAYVREGEA